MHLFLFPFDITYISMLHLSLRQVNAAGVTTATVEFSAANLREQGERDGKPTSTERNQG